MRQGGVRPRRGLLGPAELGEALLVDSEVVGDLVDDGHPDLLFQQFGIVAELVFTIGVLAYFWVIGLAHY